MMFVEIQHTWDNGAMTLTATLRYFREFTDENPVHEDVITFSVATEVGPVPAVTLNDIPGLRKMLYDRMGPIQRTINQLVDLRTALEQLPPGTRIPRARVLRMLDGVLDE